MLDDPLDDLIEILLINDLLEDLLVVY